MTIRAEVIFSMPSRISSVAYTVMESGETRNGPLSMYCERQWMERGTSTATFLCLSEGNTKRRVSVMKASTVVPSPKNWPM